jgi:serine protease
VPAGGAQAQGEKRKQVIGGDLGRAVVLSSLTVEGFHVKRNPRLHALFVATSLALAGTAVAGEFRTTDHPIRGHYIVVLKDDAAALSDERTNRPPVATVANTLARRHGATLRRSYATVLRGFAVTASDAALARLLADPAVAYVEEDGEVRAFATQTNATWGIDRIDQRDLPLSTTYTYDTTASGVHAYIIDTGIRLTHAQFSGRMGNGFDAVTSGGNASDCHGHGTHVAGTVGGTTWGVAKGVTLHPVRVLDCNGSGSNSGVIAGMDWVASNRVAPAVANMSLGGGASQSIDDAVARLTNAGVTVAVAAGNDNSNACNYSPARAASAITTGSTTSSDARSSFSNFGTCLDIFGPGSSITSAWNSSDTASNTISGTSMASPHVAGVAALYLAVNPTATPSQVTTALINNATPNKVTNPGTGSPNRLLYSLFGGGGNVAPIANFTFTTSSLTVNFTDSSSDSDGTIVSRSWNFGDGTTSTATNPTKTYAAAGTYTVTLTVTDDDGATNTKTSSVTVGGGGGNVLTNGVPVSNIGGAAGSQQFWTMNVPAGATNLKFVTSGGSGDADLYVKFGSAPTTSSYDCRSWSSTNAETCNITTAQAGTYHVLVQGYSAFSGLSLTGSYTTGGGQTYTNGTDYPINDNATVESPITVSGRSGNAPSSTPVAVNIVHTYIGDLKVDLVAPDGSIYTLHNRAGGSADNINQTYNVNLSTEALNGTWRLRVNDNANLDTGYINSWSITF